MTKMSKAQPDVHLDGPATWEAENLPCGYPFNVVRYGETTSDPAKVTCVGCLATIAKPTVHLDLGQADELAKCGYHLGDNGGEDWTTDPAKVTCAGCAPAVEPQSERRTVSLEVLTDELRQLERARRLADTANAYFKHEPLDPAALVGVVLRVDGEATAVPDVDTDWLGVGQRRHKVAVLAQLLLQADYWADATTDAELLMPLPDVLAALDGRPDAEW